jgi:perosamine synthetase
LVDQVPAITARYCGQEAVHAANVGDPGLPVSDRTIEAVTQYLRQGGPLSVGDGSGIIARLEHRLEDLLGVSNVLTCSSGTAALHSAYLALDLTPGSELIGPVTTFHASITPALHCGLSPVLVDVEPDTGNLSPTALREAITERSGCVVVTHNLGHPAELDEIGDICARHGLRLVEDCSHAYMSTYRGRPVGTTGDIAVWSMQAGKTLVAGEGGFLATRQRSLFERACLAGHYRGRSRVQITDPALRAFADTGLGLKYRLHPLAAVIAWSEAAGLTGRVRWRQELLQRLSAGLEEAPGVRPPMVRNHVTMGGWFSYRPVLAEDASGSFDRRLEALQMAGVPAHWPSVGTLESMALFTTGVPLRQATATWQPRLCGPFNGAHAWERGRVSVTVTAADDSARMDGYAAAFAATGGRPAVSGDDDG